MKKILTNYIFKFLFQNDLNIEDGDILKCNDELFIFDSSNGNPNSLKQYFSYDGFWNYIKSKNGFVFNLTTKEFVDCSEYYKNGIEVATDEDIKCYKNYLLIELNRFDIP